jgi:mono/diheme cytochrome c family protein
MRGFAYAQQVCSGCHAIEAGDMISPNPSARSFDAIANTPGMTSIALNAWLRTPHPSMPNFIIEQDRIDDLAAYIETLKRD